MSLKYQVWVTAGKARGLAAGFATLVDANLWAMRFANKQSNPVVVSIENDGKVAAAYSGDGKGVVKTVGGGQ